MTRLDDNQVAALIQLKGMDGYKVLIQIMEEEYFAAQQEITDCDPADEKAIIGAVQIARGQRVFMENVLSRIEHEANEYLGRKANSVPPPEEVEISLITGPFGQA